MDPDSRLSIIIVVLLFLAAAYCALTETALASVSKNKMKVAADRGDTRAKKVMYALEHFDEAITTLLISTNIAHIAAASVVTVIVTRKWGLSAVTLSTVVVTLLMFFLGEMLPKSIGKKIPEKASLACTGLLVVLMKILKPFERILTLFSSFVMKHSKGEEASVTEDELYDIIEDMAEEGYISDEESELIVSTLQFSDVTAGSILTPRVDVVGLDVNKSPEEAMELIKSQTHSRIPVYEDSIDNIIGVLQIRKFLRAYIANKKIPEVKYLLDEVYYTHQSTQINELLYNMSTRKINMAVITDAYGGTLGVVTVEDILEEIVGEIWDEDDEIVEPIVEIADDTYIANGDETVITVFDFMEFEDPDEEENEERFTNLLIADWALEEFPEIPEKGDSFDYYNLHISVEEIEHNRIYKLKIEVLPTEEDGASANGVEVPRDVSSDADADADADADMDADANSGEEVQA